MDEFLCLLNNHIVIDVISTWPKEIIDILETNKDDLWEYYRIENEIDLQADKNINLRINRPFNNFKMLWVEILEKINQFLVFHKFIGFHCTRLTNSEMENIIRDGLQPLSPELIIAKLTELSASGLIDKNVLLQLQENNFSSRQNRIGRVCFFHCFNKLMSEREICRLFRYWDGEALFYNFEDDPDISKVLISTGNPCIILGSLGYKDMNPYSYSTENSLAERFIEIYLNKDKKDVFLIYDFDSFIKHSVDVINLVSIDDVLFEQITNYSNWRINNIL